MIHNSNTNSRLNCSSVINLSYLYLKVNNAHKMGYDFSSTSLELKPKKINNIFEESSL